MTGLAYFLGFIVLLVVFVFFTPDWFKVLYLCCVPIYFGIATGSILVGLIFAFGIIGFMVYVSLLISQNESEKESSKPNYD